jgi:archaellum component FlaC
METGAHLMQDSKPPRSRGIGFVIVCIVVVGTGLYLNAGFNGKIADLRAELDERFKPLSEETTGVKSEIQTNRGALKRLEDGLISLESRVKSVSALATQTHDMLFEQISVQKEQDETLKDALGALVETSRELQRQIDALLGTTQAQQEQASE